MRVQRPSGENSPVRQRRSFPRARRARTSGAIRMNVNFANRMAFNPAGVNPQDEMAVGGSRVIHLLVVRQIPMRVKPVRIARGQKKPLRAVSLGQFGIRRFKMWRRRHGAECEFPAGAGDGRRCGLVAFEQERRNFNFFAAGEAGRTVLVLGLAARRGRATLAAVFFLGWRGGWFCFHNRNSLFLAINSLPGKSYGGNLPDAMGIYVRRVVNNFN